MVNSFSKEQDRSIGDVLRMPGIEVPDGKILYQGKAINKYYIEGLDLLEGKYNLANDNLPYQEVSQVQILENHQPIKTLDSLQFSDRTALNIKLKTPILLQVKLGLEVVLARYFGMPILLDAFLKETNAHYLSNE
jgi:hypothetical protein